MAINSICPTNQDGLKVPQYPGDARFYSLTANTKKSITVPTGAHHAFFHYVDSTAIYVRPADDAAVPSADDTSGASPVPNPVAWSGIGGLGTISAIAASNCKLCIVWYAI